MTSSSARDEVGEPRRGMLIEPAWHCLRAAAQDPRWFLAWPAVLATLVALWAARSFVVPIVLAIALAAILWPAVHALQALVRLRALSALLVSAAAAAIVVVLAGPVTARITQISDQLPWALQAAARDIAALDVHTAVAVRRTRSALAELDRSVAKATGTEQTLQTAREPREPSLVTHAIAAFKDGVLETAKTVLLALIQATAVAILLFFLLCSGPELPLRLARSADRALPHHDFELLAQRLTGEVRRFGLVTASANLVFGTCIAAGFAWLGIDDPISWGATAFALHFVPYAGIVLTMVLAAVSVYATQEVFSAAMIASGYAAAVGVVVGSVLMTWMQGRSARIDSGVLFAGTLFWSMLWGAWGLILGPLMMVVGRCATRHVLDHRGATSTATASATGPRRPRFPPASAGRCATSLGLKAAAIFCKQAVVRRWLRRA